MQRWIILGVVAMVLILGGAGFAYRSYNQNRPHPVWVPLPINPALSVEKRDEIARELKSKLLQIEILLQVSRDLDLPKKWNLATHEVAARQLGERLFVKVGEANGPMGKVPSINIGFSGKEKDKELTEKLALRLMEDVWKIAGIKPPTSKITPPF